MPAVTTAPSGASATPETASAAEVPKGRVCRQARAVRRDERGQRPARPTWPARLAGEHGAVRAAVHHAGGEPAGRVEGGLERPSQAVRRIIGVDGRSPGDGGRPEQDEPAAGRGHPGHLRLRAGPRRRQGRARARARGRHPGRAAVAAQPGGADPDRHRPPGLAGDFGGDDVTRDQDPRPGRRHVPEVQGVAAARGQVKPRRVEPLPGDPVGRQEDQRGSPGLVATGHVRADGDEARRRPLHRADLVAGEQRHPGAGRQRPGPAVRARPDRAGAEGDPRALAAGHEDGAVPGRRHAAVRPTGPFPSSRNARR